MYDPFPSPSSVENESSIPIHDQITFQYSKAKKLYNGKHYQEAIPEYDKLIELDIHIHMPSLVEPFLMEFAYCFSMTGEVDISLFVIDQLLELDPKNADCWRFKGDIMNNAERYNDAIQAYDNALRINPKDGYALQGKGNSLRFLKRYDEALTLLKAASRLL